MKIWITGAHGLVGQALQELCKKRGISFIATAKAEADIGCFEDIHSFSQSSKDITHLINCAAYTKVDEAEKKSEEAFKANTLGPENLGKLASLHPLKLVHLSTDYVFDSEKNALHQETDRCLPSSIYAKTKYEGELRLLKTFPSACIVRTSWVFGSGGKNFISSLWSKIHQEKTISVVDDQINRLTYTADLAEALLALLDQQGIYHFANQGIVSRYEVALQMKQLLQESGRPLNCEEILPVPASAFPAAAPRPRFSTLDTQKIESLGIKPRPWQEALKEYVHGQLS